MTAAPVRRGNTARTTPRELSMIDWLSARPLALRSSVMKARRARTPWRGLLTFSGEPSRVMLPRATDFRTTKWSMFQWTIAGSLSSRR